MNPAERARKASAMERAIERLASKPPQWWGDTLLTVAMLVSPRSDDREGHVKTLLEQLFPAGLGDLADLEGDSR
jgi:hypothetical protein